MQINWRKINNILHRDVGYFFFGMTIIYALSGIALNHINDWDPNYVIENRQVNIDPSVLSTGMSKKEISQLMAAMDIRNKVKNHYYPQSNTVKVFLEGGSFTLNINTGRGFLETVRRRPVFFEVNYLHYNHTKFLWTWFSDIFAGGLIVLAITGLFVLKGKNGFKRRGIWFVLVGVLIPLAFLLVYL